DERAALVQQVETVPAVTLHSGSYKLIQDFEPRFPHGGPSLKEAVSLDVQGDWTFGADVSVIGDAVLGEEGGEVPEGARVGAASAASPQARRPSRAGRARRGRTPQARGPSSAAASGGGFGEASSSERPSRGPIGGTVSHPVSRPTTRDPSSAASR